MTNADTGAEAAPESVLDNAWLKVVAYTCV